MPSDKVAVIAIDEQSIANIGRWPWPREVQAKLIDQLAAAKAKVIGNTVFFFEPQMDPGLAYVEQDARHLQQGVSATRSAATSPACRRSAARRPPRSPPPAGEVGEIGKILTKRRSR